MNFTAALQYVHYVNYPVLFYKTGIYYFKIKKTAALNSVSLILSQCQLIFSIKVLTPVVQARRNTVAPREPRMLASASLGR